MSAAAEELMKKGEGKIGRLFFNDPEGAYECFHKAGAAFKSEANFARAGDAFMRAGDLSVKCENPGDACNAYTECAKMYSRTSDSSRAGDAIKMAVQINIDNARLGSAARLLQNWGETNEQIGNTEAALAAYKRASELYFAEDQKSSVNQCKMRMANLYGMSKNWSEASKLYEVIAMTYADGPTKTMAKDPFFKSFLCRVAAVPPENRMEGSSGLGDSLEMILGYDPHFRNTREHDVCILLVEGMQEEDEEKVDDAIRTMDSFKMLDDLKTRIMNHVKDGFNSVC